MTKKVTNTFLNLVKTQTPPLIENRTPLGKKEPPLSSELARASPKGLVCNLIYVCIDPN